MNNYFNEVKKNLDGVVSAITEAIEKARSS